MTLHPVHQPSPAAIVISPNDGGYAHLLSLDYIGVFLHDTALEGEVQWEC